MKREQRTYHFSCDAPGCKAVTTYNLDTQPPNWVALTIHVLGDRKEQHYCIEHADAVLVYLRLRKPPEPPVCKCSPPTPPHAQDCPMHRGE